MFFRKSVPQAPGTGRLLRQSAEPSLQKFQNPESSRRLVPLLKAGAARTTSRFPFSMSPLANLRAGISPHRNTRKPHRNVSSRPARLPVVCPDRLARNVME
jgi:hypothetical protein